MEKDLEQIAQEFEEAVKEAGLLKRCRGGAFDMYWSGGPEHVAYAETESYKVLAAKWEEHSWSDCGGGIGWTERLNVYFAPRDGGDIMEISGEPVATRSSSSAAYDKRWLWPYDFAGVKALEGNRIETAWLNEKGDKEMVKIYDLDEQYAMIKKSKGHCRSVLCECG